MTEDEALRPVTDPILAEIEHRKRLGLPLVEYGPIIEMTPDPATGSYHMTDESRAQYARWLNGEDASNVGVRGE